MRLIGGRIEERTPAAATSSGAAATAIAVKIIENFRQRLPVAEPCNEESFKGQVVGNAIVCQRAASLSQIQIRNSEREPLKLISSLIVGPKFNQSVITRAILMLIRADGVKCRFLHRSSNVPAVPPRDGKTPSFSYNYKKSPLFSNLQGSTSQVTKEKKRLYF